MLLRKKYVDITFSELNYGVFAIVGHHCQLYIP